MYGIKYGCLNIGHTCFVVGGGGYQPLVRSTTQRRKAMRRLFATLFLTCAMAVGVTAPIASAQGPIVTGGLVDVTIVDVLNNNTILSDINVAAAVAVAANVCDVGVNVLATQLGSGNDATCTNTVNGTTATITR